MYKVQQKIYQNSCNAGSNQVQNNCLEDATMKSSPLNGSDKNDEHQRIKFKEIKSDMDVCFTSF